MKKISSKKFLSHHFLLSPYIACFFHQLDFKLLHLSNFGVVVDAFLFGM